MPSQSISLKTKFSYEIGVLGTHSDSIIKIQHIP